MKSYEEAPLNYDFLIEAVLTASENLLEKFNIRNEKLILGLQTDFVEEKAKRELVVQEDLISEKIITELIQMNDPGARVYSEECNHLSELSSDRSPRKYIIDPLDGTHNFYFGIPFWGISVGVLDENNFSVGGVISLPVFNILLKNQGPNESTFLHSLSGWHKTSILHKHINESLICYDNQFYKIGHRAIENFERLAKEAFTTRITGSAVADAAFIALGRSNARVFNNTNSYDIAAGISIVKGAGGKVTNFCGDEIDVMSGQVVMSSGDELHDSIMKIFCNE